MKKDSSFEGRSVLIVDDQEIIHKMLKSLLDKLGFGQVDSAFNGSEALKTLDSNRYDLILCDVVMTELDGLDFVRTLRKSANLRYDASKAATPVILMSGSSDPNHLRAAKEVGVQGYILKPFDPKSVTARLEKALAD